MNEEDKREVPTDQPVSYQDIHLSDELTADLVMQRTHRWSFMSCT